MRRKDKKITDNNEIEEILHSAMIGRLGTTLNNIPYITPVNFVYYDGKVLLHSANSGHKLDNIKANNNVCFEIEDAGPPVIKDPICASTVIYRSVIMFCKASILQENTEKFSALKRIIEKYTNKPFLGSFTDSILGRVTVIELSVESMTAKISPAKVQY